MSARTLTPPSPARSLIVVAGFRIARARIGALAWGLGLAAMSGLIVSIYPSFSSDLAEVVEAFPTKLRDAFGIDDYDSARSFLNGEMYSLLVPLAVALFGIRQVAHDVVGHEERTWMDVELATPLGRTALILGSYLAALTGIAEVAVLTGAGAWIAAVIAGVDLPLSAVAEGALAVWLLAAGFAAVALVLSSVSHRSGVVIAGATATLVAMYVVNLAGTLVHGLRAIRVLSPFDHYGTPVADGISLSSIGAMALTAAVLVALATWLFDRHDVRG